MKKRKSIIIMSLLAIALTIGAVVMNVVSIMELIKNGHFQDYIKTVTNLFENIKNADALLLYVPAGIIAGTIVLTLIWLIWDLIRKKPYVLLTNLFLIIAGLLGAVFYIYFYPHLKAGKPFEEMTEFITIALYGGAILLFVITFFVDVITGGKKRAQRKAALASASNVSVQEEAPAREEALPVYEEIKEEEHQESSIDERKDEPVPSEEEVIAEEDIKDEPNEKKAKKPASRKTTTVKKADIKSKMLENESGQKYAKAYHVSRRPELNKWQVKITGSEKALKLFNTQKEAIEYANELAKSQGASVRVHSKTGKLRKQGSGEKK